MLVSRRFSLHRSIHAERMTCGEASRFAQFTNATRLAHDTISHEASAMPMIRRPRAPDQPQRMPAAAGAVRSPAPRPRGPAPNVLQPPARPNPPAAVHSSHGPPSAIVPIVSTHVPSSTRVATIIPGTILPSAVNSTKHDVNNVQPRHRQPEAGVPRPPNAAAARGAPGGR